MRNLLLLLLLLLGYFVYFYFENAAITASVFDIGFYVWKIDRVVV